MHVLRVLWLKAAILGLAAAPCWLAQTRAASLIDAGQKAFAEHCSACHGANADGGEMGPNLSGTRRLRTRTEPQLRTLIRQGSPSQGMPSFALPEPMLDALAAFVRSLNTTAADANLPGDTVAGRQYFFGEGRCADCHMIRGRGKALGPDLSNVGRELIVGEIRQVLKDPSSRITPGYEVVTVELKEGNSLRGFARGQTNYDLQLQEFDGKFHLLQMPQIAAVRHEKQSLMKPVQASGEQLQNLVAYLANVTRVEDGFRKEPLSAGPGIEFERIANPNSGDWLTYNGSLNGNRYSNLKQINRSNVSGLAMKWMFPIDHFGLEVTPLVADGIMYITGPNQALALDALTGRQLWKYSRPRTAGLVGDASLGTNRGVAIQGDKVFMTTDNAHLIALNRVTGALVWDVYMPEEPQKYGSTVAPLIVKDTIVAGVSGGDRGIRGFLACYKTSTGEMLWRRWNIPKKGEKGSETWIGAEPVFGGGATWLTGAYDPAADTLYWPTGNPWPDSDDKERGGDNLYTNCILAMDPATGNLKWHFQFTPHDVHDWDATEPPLLVDTLYRGSPRKLLLHADRNGFFYVLDRISGEMLHASQFAKSLTWTTGIGADGRPLPPPAIETPLDCPSDAANWNSAAYSEASRSMYVLTMEQCRAKRGLNWKAEQPVPEPQKLLRAINIDSGKTMWEIPFLGTMVPKTWPGVMATAGGLVFYSDPNGTFAASDEQTGTVLWHFPTNVSMKASPMTFAVGGRQFIGTVAGPNVVVFGLP